MKRTYAKVTLVSTTPYAQSRNHSAPRLEDETFEEYEERTWRLRMHVRNKTDGSGTKVNTVVIPAVNVSHSLTFAAKLLDRPVDVSGIRILRDLDLGLSPDDCRRESVNAHVSGQRESSERGVRYFPTFDEWRATAEVMIVDQDLSEEVLIELFETAGVMIGVGQFRPQTRGTNGCWRVETFEWDGPRVITTPSSESVIAS